VEVPEAIETLEHGTNEWDYVFSAVLCAGPTAFYTDAQSETIERYAAHRERLGPTYLIVLPSRSYIPEFTSFSASDLVKSFRNLPKSDQQDIEQTIWSKHTTWTSSQRVAFERAIYVDLGNTK